MARIATQLCIGIMMSALLMSALLMGTGCPGTLDDPSRFLLEGGVPPGGDSGACPDIPTDIFAKTCATSGCHSTADMIQGLDLQAPNVASRLVGVCARGGGLLIDPTHPSQSVIYEKLTLTPPFGSRMPLGKTPLDDPTLACVLTWVSEQQGDAGSCTEGGAPPEAGADAAGE